MTYKFSVPIPRGTKSLRIVVDGEDAITTFPAENKSEYNFSSDLPWKYSNGSYIGDAFRIFADLTNKDAKPLELVPTLIGKV